MIRCELSAKLAVAMAITKDEADHIVQSFLSAIIKGCKEEGRVVIMGFCTFKVKVARAKTIHNVWSQKSQNIPQKNKIVFKPSKKFKAMVNDGAPQKEISNHSGQSGDSPGISHSTN